MKLLALDVGDKRVGIATSDELGVGIWPQKTFLRQNPKQDAAKLSEIILEQSPQIIVVGLPFNMDGTEGAQAKKVRQFIKDLEKEFPADLCPSIRWHDERLTSWDAEQRLKDRGLKGKKIKAEVDAMAACLILEDFLKEKI